MEKRFDIYIYRFLFCFTLLIFLLFNNKMLCKAENIVVVIDPGHGGENLGGQTEEYIEQELTLQVANYMKERLEQYEGIDVYLTHSSIGEKDLSREERAEIASEYNADFLYSLHFNMSEKHTLFGAEVWTSAFGEYYVKGQEFARIEMEGLHGQLGFFDRGIKTRLGKTGDDYYGIILKCKEKGIPAVIIEHCHMDEDRDNWFLRDNDNPYQILGYTDADSVAKYFHLKSQSLGVDYSDYQYERVAMPAGKIGHDRSEPEYCDVKLIDIDNTENMARVEISSHDPDSVFQYFQYSKDGGVTYSKLLPWNNDTNANEASRLESIEAFIPLTALEESKLVVRAYNRFDLYAESNMIILPAGEEPVTYTEEASEEIPGSAYKDYELITYNVNEPVKKKTDINIIDDNTLYIVGGVFILSLLVSVLLVVTIMNVGRKRRRKRRNDRRKRGNIY